MSGIVVLISGRGSNMEALVSAGAPVTAVISNRADAGGLAIAQSHGIETAVVSHRDFPDRETFDAALAARIEVFRPALVVLAGFMRILTAGFVHRFQGRLINVHPSLLPSFTGLDTHQRAIDAGVRLHGCTVHYVTDVLDHGPIIAQAAVPVLADDTADSLAARVLEQEHRLLPAAVRWHLDGHLRVNRMRVSLVGDEVSLTALRVPDPA